MDTGALSATISGIALMLLLSADNWAIPQQVRWICKQSSIKLYQAIAIGSIAFRNSRFGQLSSSILLDRISCTGNEQTLLNCSHIGHGVVSPYCNINDLAGVECPGKTQT